MFSSTDIRNALNQLESMSFKAEATKRDFIKMQFSITRNNKYAIEGP